MILKELHFTLELIEIKTAETIKSLQCHLFVFK